MATPQFGFITLSDAFTTGSFDHAAEAQSRRRRAGPRQDRPDSRGARRPAVVMKGLPLAYGKDMQEDKVPVFEAFDALELCLAAMTGMIADLSRTRSGWRGRRRRLRDGHRPRRLAGAPPRPAVPPGASRGRPGGEAGRGAGRRTRRAAARRATGARTADHRRRLRGADAGRLGGQPHQLRRHGAGSACAAKIARWKEISGEAHAPPRPRRPSLVAPSPLAASRATSTARPVGARSKAEPPPRSAPRRRGRNAAAANR